MALGARSLTAEWKGLVTLLLLLQSGSDTPPPAPLCPPRRSGLCRDSVAEQSPRRPCPPDWGEIP